MAHQFIFSLERVQKIVPPSREVLKPISLSFLPGAKIGVIGPNGSGKSTLVKIIAGVDTEHNGKTWHPDGIRIGYLPQEPRLDPTKDVRGNVEEAVSSTRALLRRFEDLTARMGESLSPDEMDKVMEEYGKVQDAIEACNGWDLDTTVNIAMEALRLPPPDADVSRLSGGEVRRVALCKVLLEQPDILLLDEPTNHLDAESVAWLERHLEEFPGTVIAVTHDRYFLDNVAGWILELDRGEGIPFKGNYTSWLEQKQARLSLEEKQASARRRTIERELAWVRTSPKARQAKGKARLGAYEQLLAEDARFQERDAEIEIAIPAGPRLGDDVLTVENLRKGFGDRLLVDGLSLVLPKAAIVGIIGANGTGKTTLFRMITGEEKPDSGVIRLGETVKLAYVDQSRDSLNGENTVWQEISGGKETLEFGKREMNSRAYVSSFNFRGPDHQKKVKDLSGGERNRVHLAKLLKSGGNLLLLDEPTNDLDVDTLRALEEGILGFAGCAMVISHDRWFLDRIATHILAFEGESQVIFHTGNFQDYEADRRRLLGGKADQPHRVKYRKLVKG